MDPIAHTFTGGALAASGLRRASPLATVTLLVAANAPDADVVALAWGSPLQLAWRRGITHGVPAMVLLPFIVVGAVLLGHRAARTWRRRRRKPRGEGPERGRPRELGRAPERAAPARRGAPMEPEAEAQPRPFALLTLAALGVSTHPFLDWLNTYGMRWLAPIDWRWSYGDAVFIVDPWLWLLLGGATFAGFSGRRATWPFWGLLALLLSLPVLLSGVVPPGARAAWLLGLAGWILVRWRVSRKAAAAGSALSLAALYVLVMIGQTLVAERIVAAEAADDPRIGSVESVMVGPVPANPFAGQIVVVTPEAYWTGGFRWGAAPRVVWNPEPMPRPEPDAVIRAAESHPDARAYLAWARFPLYRVEESEEGWRVRIGDARYPDAGTGLGGVTVLVGADTALLGPGSRERSHVR